MTRPSPLPCDRGVWLGAVILVFAFAWGLFAGVLIMRMRGITKHDLSQLEVGVRAAVAERDAAIKERDFWRMTLRRIVEGEEVSVIGRVSNAD